MALRGKAGSFEVGSDDGTLPAVPFHEIRRACSVAQCLNAQATGPSKEVQHSSPLVLPRVLNVKDGRPYPLGGGAGAGTDGPLEPPALFISTCYTHVSNKEKLYITSKYIPMELGFNFDEFYINFIIVVIINPKNHLAGLLCNQRC